MEDICDILKSLAETIRAREVWYDGEVEVSCALREKLAEGPNLFFFAHTQTDFVTRIKALADDVRADEASCAGDEDEKSVNPFFTLTEACDLRQSHPGNVFFIQIASQVRHES